MVAVAMPQFFPQPSRMTVRTIVEITGAEPRTGALLDGVVTGIASPERARPSDLTFVDNDKYLDRLAASRAGACLTTAELAGRAPAGLSVLVTAEPFRDFVTVARTLYPDSLRPRSLFEMQAVASGAIVHPTAQVEDGVTIDPGAVIGPRAGIGEGTVIGVNAVIGPDVQIGRDCSIGPAASVTYALIGDGVVLHGGCRIGQDGFQYHRGNAGYIKVPQHRRVIIQDRVEIGANTTIDRGSNGDTVIGEGAKIDNLVQIGHNCTIGRHCIIAAGCGLSGGVMLGDHVMLAGQVGVADHICIGEGAVVAANTRVISDISGQPERASGARDG